MWTQWPKKPSGFISYLIIYLFVTIIFIEGLSTTPAMTTIPLMINAIFKAVLYGVPLSAPFWLMLYYKRKVEEMGSDLPLVRVTIISLSITLFLFWLAQTDETEAPDFWDFLVAYAIWETLFWVGTGGSLIVMGINSLSGVSRERRGKKRENELSLETTTSLLYSKPETKQCEFEAATVCHKVEESAETNLPMATTTSLLHTVSETRRYKSEAAVASQRELTKRMVANAEQARAEQLKLQAEREAVIRAQQERTARFATLSQEELLYEVARYATTQMFVERDTLAVWMGIQDKTRAQELLNQLQSYHLLTVMADQKRYWTSFDEQEMLEHLEKALEQEKELNKDKQEVSQMTGYQFEHYCAAVLLKNGFSKSEVTQSSGDYGVDIVAEKDGITYGIQCKYYNAEKVGIKAVQEAFSGAQFYDCMIAVVMTNGTFTTAAIEMARKTKVKLWDGNKLVEMERENSPTENSSTILQ